MQRWHAGLRVTGQRPLERAELDELRALRSDSRKRFTYSVLRLLLVVLVPFALRMLPLSSFIHDIAFLATPGLLVAVALVGLPAAMRQTLQLPRRLGRDLSGGLVDICEGSRDEMITAARDLPDWQTGSATESSASPCVIEVLPSSHLLWSVDGERASELRLLHSSVTAHAPQHAELAAQFVRQVDADAPFLVHSRALSRAELNELESYAPKPHLSDIALPAVLWITAFAAFALSIAQQWSTLLVPFVLGVAALALTPRAVRSVRTRRWIAPDVREGRVVIIRWRSKDDEGNEQLSPPVEFLPHSKVVWSERSGPAPWRRIVNGVRFAE